jgi:hypothetical protein
MIYKVIVEVLEDLHIERERERERERDWINLDSNH